MVSSKWVAVVAAMIAYVSGGEVVFAAAATTSTQATESKALAIIAGDTVTEDEVSSFALQLEMSEARRFPSQEAIFNEYILTQLYEQIPTTATIEAEANGPESPTPYDLVVQRAVLKRELRDLINKTVEVPRSDMEAWYQKNADRYTKPERVHAWHLFLETSEDNESSSPEKVRSRLKEIKSQIDTGTSFSAAAKQHSEAASGKAGGEIGFITRRMPIGPLSKPMNIELEEAFFALPVGKVSDVVETRHGMHLLYVTDRETTRTPSVDDMISSGILPGVLAQDRLTSEIKSTIAATIERHNGKVLPEWSGQDVTTDTVAFNLNGKDYTIGHLIAVFGPRFTNYLETAKQDPGALRDLMQQAMDDEAMVLAAVDKGIAAHPQIATQLNELVQRAKASERIEAIAKAESKVTDAEVERRYNELKDELRQPVAEGFVLMVKSEQATGTAEQARAREYARRKAEDILKRLQTEDFQKVADSLKVDSTVQIEVSRVPQHVIGQSTDTQTRIFDQAISGITEDTGLSQVVPMGADFAIAKLEKRGPGEPVPLEVVRERLESMLEGEKQTEARDKMVERLEETGLVKYLPAAGSYGKSVTGQVEDINTTEPQ